MEQVFHLYISVNSDEAKIDNFDGTLADYACEKMNRIMSEESFRAQYGDNVHIISITNSFWTSEKRPLECNSSTWYDVDYCRLSVYLAKN